jgi:hypothetical protein
MGGNPNPVKQWKPGQSGNPDGRTKAHAELASEIQLKAQSLCVEALGVLADRGRGDRAIASTQLAAARQF